jgi:hypothetical protein
LMAMTMTGWRVNHFPKALSLCVDQFALGQGKRHIG